MVSGPYIETKAWLCLPQNVWGDMNRTKQVGSNGNSSDLCMEGASLNLGQDTNEPDWGFVVFLSASRWMLV
jgi:hypothetical protein